MINNILFLHFNNNKYLAYQSVCKHLGMRTFTCTPNTKYALRNFIKFYSIDTIFCDSRYYIRKLPIDYINNNNIKLIIEVFPYNSSNKTYFGQDNYTDCADINLISSINKDLLVLHTDIINENQFNNYFDLWPSNMYINKISVAADSMNYNIDSLKKISNVHIEGIFDNKPGTISKFLLPIVDRMNLIDIKYQIWGDNCLSKFGIQHNGLPIDNQQRANIYSSCDLFINLHTQQHRNDEATLNESIFNVSLCGTQQLTDNNIINNFNFPRNSIISSNDIKDFIFYFNDIFHYGEKYKFNTRKLIEFVASKHTYFNRFADILRLMKMDNLADNVLRENKRLSLKRLIDFDNRSLLC